MIPPSAGSMLLRQAPAAASRVVHASRSSLSAQAQRRLLSALSSRVGTLESTLYAPRNNHLNVISKQSFSSTTGDEPPKQETDEAKTQDSKSEEPAQQTDPVPALEAQVKDLKDQLLRSLAEQENTRRIAQRDVDTARQFAIKSFAKSLLEVADNLERALQAVPEDDRKAEATSTLTTLYQGIQMTEQGLLKTFQMHGLIKYGQVGELFDPNKHAALYEYVDASKTPGTVGQIMKPGFMLHKQVLRPAEVGVIKKA
jgi:molecular chaperone GrpE